MTAERGPESVLARLRTLGRTTDPNVPPNTLLLLYAQQGLLARLDASPHAGQYVLKGALSLFARYGDAARPTEDLDLAARGQPNTPEHVQAVFQGVCAVSVPDGLTFDGAGVRVRPMGEAQAYPGVEVRVTAWLGRSRADLQVDVSFGNAITPAPVTWTFPPLLREAGVSVPISPLETVLAEKFAALAELGEASTRMKDLYDLHVILGKERFEAGEAASALRRSFAARGTPESGISRVLSPAFAASDVLAPRWRTYLVRTRLGAPPYPEVLAQLQAFFGPLLEQGVSARRWSPVAQQWQRTTRQDGP